MAGRPPTGQAYNVDPTKKPAEMAGWENRRKSYPAQAVFVTALCRRSTITPTKATPPKIAA